VITNDQIWWHLARASGIVAWVLLASSVVWGLLLSTRLLREVDRPAWLLDLHRWLGTLTWATTAVHLATLMADSFVQFTAADLFIPFSSSWKPGAIAWGIVAMYLLVVIQVSSRWMRQLPRPVWHAIHLASYPTFAMVSIHSFAAGTDAGNRLFLVLGTSLVVVVGVTTAARIVLQTGTKRGSQLQRANRPKSRANA
jgi:sulfoxide reductase heme-binding subunit YedZ